MSQPTWNYFFVVGIVLFLIIFAYNLMHHSPLGRAFRTIKCDVEVSTILGIPVVKYKLLAFAMSATYASIAGSLIMYLNRFISSDSYTVNDSIDYIVAAVVGGPESILGCAIGGLFLTFQKDLSAGMGNFVLRGNHLARMFYGIIMILVVFVAPRGIAGEFSRKLKSRFISKTQRGKYYYSPPPDYDFLEMKGSTIKEE
jgi:branched-chain amino acid transport system permease protein